MSCCFINETPSNQRLLDSHVPAPLAPEVLAQAVDLPQPVVIEANNINVENIPSTGTKSVESKIPKWLKLARSEYDLLKFAMWLMLLLQKNKLSGASI